MPLSQLALDFFSWASGMIPSLAAYSLEEADVNTHLVLHMYNLPDSYR